MLETMKYINHVNEVIEFGKNGIFVNSNDLHDYSWTYETTNNKISYFDKGVQTRTLPVVVADDSNGVKVINNLMECAEKDVLAKQSGKLVVGDYYIRCYITASKKTNYSLHRGYMNIELSVVVEYPMWIKEYTTLFRGDGGVVLPDTSTGDAQVNLDYSYDFPYDFSSTASNSSIVNNGFMPSDFKMILYGQATSPSLYIGGHQYSLSCSVSSGEYLEIDSKNKTIYLVEQDGTRNNYFRYRNKSSYIFEKIPSGENTVTWARGFSFDVTLYEERSEPKWT